MILFAIAVYLLGSSYAAPFSTSSHETNLTSGISNLVSVAAGPLDQQCTCVAQRSFWDILWSCLATIFACSWVSVHPNMPEKGESPVMVISRRLELMAWTIVAPELIVTWAIRQWLGAHWLAKEYKKAEIKDRSKADVLNKTLVLGQTTWFVIQCVARSAQGLIITEIELITVAFAFLHGFMYFLWLDKPLSAQYPIVVHLLPNAKDPIVEDPPDDPPPDGTAWYKKLYQFLIRKMEYFCKIVPNNILQYFKNPADWMISRFIASIKPLEVIRLYDIFVIAPTEASKLFIQRLRDMVEKDTFDESPETMRRVPTFYAMEAKEKENIPLAVTSRITVVFGAIHCAGWGFAFETPADAWMWRVPSAIITGIPCSAIVVDWCFTMFLKQSNTPPIVKRMLGYILLFAGGFTVITLPFYILARFVLLAEALAGMRRLLPGAHAMVEWSDFLPHI